MDGVKNLVVQKNVTIKDIKFNSIFINKYLFVFRIKKFPITRIADNLIEQKSSPETDDYRYFDPKLIKNDGYSFEANLHLFFAFYV